MCFYVGGLSRWQRLRAFIVSTGCERRGNSPSLIVRLIIGDNFSEGQLGCTCQNLEKSHPHWWCLNIFEVVHRCIVLCHRRVFRSSLFSRLVWSFFTWKSGSSAYVHFLNVFLVLFRVLICEYEVQREVNIETVSATTYVNSVYILAASKYHVCGQADGVDSVAFYTSIGAGLRAEAGRGEGWPPRVEVGLYLKHKTGSFESHMHFQRELPFRLSFSLPNLLFLEEYLV